MKRRLLPALLLPLVILVPSAVLGIAWSGSAAPQAQITGSQETSCITCHGDEELFEGDFLQIVESVTHDVHTRVGLSCHDCHGGNPDPALAEDFVAAKDEALERNPYIGVPERAEMPGFCGRCHSDPNYMRRFNPDARVDQEREYWTSHHGLALEQGDTGVATCIDCHGVHGILRASDRNSLIYPTRVAETCGSCHGNVELMSGRTLADGRPFPVDQQARWQQSVHAEAMLQRDDLSAPTCNDCHGNHGAQPPGVDSVAFICGQCHGREAEIFRQSPKHAGFELHNEYLADVEGEGCIACHEPPEPQARVTGIKSFTECATCHGNHGIVRPTVAILAPLPEVPCAFCHEGTATAIAEVAGPAGDPFLYQDVRDALLEESAELGLAGNDQFDWMVTQAQSLEFHTLRVGRTEGDQPQLRPEFERLFNRFRIGPTAYSFEDPVTGEVTSTQLMHCDYCHPSDVFVGARGLPLAEDLLNRQRELTFQIAQAERVLLTARRGGVETREALLDIDQAIDSQIELEVLVHAFSTEEGGEFVAKQAEGLEHATAALEAGLLALEDLAYRRRGLFITLVFIVLVLIGLGLKINEISRREAERAASLPPKT